MDAKEEMTEIGEAPGVEGDAGLKSDELPDYRSGTCPSGIRYYRSRNQDFAFDGVATLLSESWPCYFLVNFKRAGIELPESLAKAVDFFDNEHLPNSVRAEDSLVFVSWAKLDNPASMLRDFGGKDALCVLYSSKPESDLVEQLRHVSGWYARPGSLCHHLARGSQSLTEKLVKGIEAILIEAEGPFRWEIYAGSEETPDWVEIGLPSPS